MYELPYGNTQQLNLDWFIKRWQEFYTQWQETEADIDHALDAEIQRVEDAMTDLYAARDAAAASATAAAGSASSASNDATTATNAATAAAASATLANSKATAAGLSEAAAANSANSASNSATAAAMSASQASASETSATASAQSATASKTTATAAAQTATSKAEEATTAAETCEDVLESIPDDYTTLSNNVAANTAILESNPINLLTPYYINAEDFTMSFSAANTKTIHLKGNVIEQTGGTGSGSTFSSFSLFTNTRFLGNSITAAIQNLTDDDFIPVNLTERSTLILNVSYLGKRTTNNSRGSGYIYAVTKNPVTEEITYIDIVGVTLQETGYRNANFDVYLLALLPEIADNENVCFVYTSRYPNITEKFVLSLYCRTINSTSIKTAWLISAIAQEEKRFIATKNYSVNEIITIADRCYIVTVPIATGETIVVGTNVDSTTLGELITQLLNS